MCPDSSVVLSKYINMIKQLGEVYKKNPKGTYFNNKVISPCTHHQIDLSTCYINGTCGCTCYIGPNGYSAIQCLGFAAKIFNYIHDGVYLDSSDASSKHIIRKLKNENDLQCFLSEITIGSHIRVKSGAYAHSIIIYMISYNYIEIYDANNDFKCGIDKRKLSYKDFLARYSIIYTFNNGGLL